MPPCSSSASSSSRLRPARWMKTSASVGSSECSERTRPRADELLQPRARRASSSSARRCSEPSSSTTSTSGASSPQAELQRARRVERDDLALGEEGDARAELVGLVHVVRREEDRRAAVGERAHDLAQVARRLRVQAARRLVEEQHARRVEQRAREQQALAHAGRERLDLALGDLAQAHLARAPRAARPLRQPVERAEELEVLLRRRALVDVRRLGDEVDLRRGSPRARAARRGRAPCARPLVGFARPVRIRIIVDLPAPLWPSRPKISPGAASQADAVERVDVAVVLGQILDRDRVTRRGGGLRIVLAGVVG